MFIFSFALIVTLTLLSPLLGVMALFGFMPAYLLRTAFFGIPTTFLEVATYAVLLGLFFHLAYNRSLRAYFKNKILWLWQNQRPLVLASSLLLISALISTFITVDLQRSAGVLKAWFVAPMLAGMLLFLIVRSRKDILSLAVVLSGLTATLSVYGLLVYFLPDPAVYDSYQARLFSIYTSANYIAMLIGPVITFTIGLLVFVRDWGKFGWVRFVLAGSLLFNLWAFYLTRSYGAYLGLALAIFLLIAGLVFEKPRSKKFILTIATSSLLLLGVVFVATVNSPKFERDFGNLEGESSLRGRMEIWQTSLEIIERHPIFGLGLGNFDEGYVAYVSEVSDDPMEKYVIHAHNIFLNFWNEAGLVGLIMFLLVMIAAARLFFQARKIEPALAYSSAAALVVILGHGLIDTPYFKNDLSYLFWMFLFLLVLSTRTEIRENK